MVEQWFPKPEVKGSSPFSPVVYEHILTKVALPWDYNRLRCLSGTLAWQHPFYARQ